MSRTDLQDQNIFRLESAKNLLVQTLKKSKKGWQYNSNKFHDHWAVYDYKMCKAQIVWSLILLKLRLKIAGIFIVKNIRGHCSQVIGVKLTKYTKKSMNSVLSQNVRYNKNIDNSNPRESW